jgi:hypothetical protein
VDPLATLELEETGVVEQRITDACGGLGTERKLADHRGFDKLLDRPRIDADRGCGRLADRTEARDGHGVVDAVGEGGRDQRRTAATMTAVAGMTVASVNQVCARRRRSINSRRSCSKRSHRSLNRAIQGSTSSGGLTRQLVDHALVSFMGGHLPPPAQQMATGIAL